MQSGKNARAFVCLLLAAWEDIALGLGMKKRLVKMGMDAEGYQGEVVSKSELLRKRWVKGRKIPFFPLKQPFLLYNLFQLFSCLMYFHPIILLYLILINGKFINSKINR